MFVSLIYIVFAILALSFLIFIHELGHYIMARRTGMKVETFAIGFGRPIYSWQRNGVTWQIGWILFGGYVKIKGQEIENGRDPYSIPDSFFGKSAWDRIKVAFMGPFVNLVFAFLLFSFLWINGGREKNFADYTKKIGWVDPQSELYRLGIRPGDEIIAYNNKTFEASKDHLYAPMTSSGEIDIKGNKVNYQTSEKVPFEYNDKTYPHPVALAKGVVTSGILQSAGYLIYNTFPGGKENPLPEGSPLQGSGIKYGDRIVWVDGELVFSVQQLNHILNNNRVLLTLMRNGKIILKRVPRVQVQELKLDPEVKEELVDWQFEAGLNSIKIPKLYTIPYNINNECVVENQVKFIDQENQDLVFPKHPFSDLETPLQTGDKIIAIDGAVISYAYQLLAQLQQRHVNIIVERDPDAIKKLIWNKVDEDFDRHLDMKSLNQIAQKIGTHQLINHSGNYYLLKPVVPKKRSEFKLSIENQAILTSEINEQKKEIEAIEDPEKRAQALQILENREKQLMLGLPSVQDRRVDYNPLPNQLFANVFSEIWHTFSSLITGTLNPKWLSGPIGIVQVVHESWMISLREALFWIAAISLNLGVLNLFPIPMLDGGTIFLSLIEMLTGKRISPKTLEKVLIPFAILLIGFFIYLTFNDLTRIFQNFWQW